MATESEKIDDDFRRLTAEIDELNADLCELEEEIGLAPILPIETNSRTARACRFSERDDQARKDEA